MKYAVVFEKGDRNFAAYVPDLPRCVSTGKTRAEVEETSARQSPSTWMVLGQPIPVPTAWIETVELPVAGPAA